MADRSQLMLAASSVREGTGSWGAGLARSLATAKITVIEINRPDRQARRRHGKNDTVDAIASARAAVR